MITPEEREGRWRLARHITRLLPEGIEAHINDSDMDDYSFWIFVTYRHSPPVLPSGTASRWRAEMNRLLADTSYQGYLTLLERPKAVETRCDGLRYRTRTYTRKTYLYRLNLYGGPDAVVISTKPKCPTRPGT